MFQAHLYISCPQPESAISSRNPDYFWWKIFSGNQYPGARCPTQMCVHTYLYMYNFKLWFLIDRSESSCKAPSTCRVHSQCSINAGWHDIYVEFLLPYYLFLQCLHNLHHLNLLVCLETCFQNTYVWGKGPNSKAEGLVHKEAELWG